MSDQQIESLVLTTMSTLNKIDSYEKQFVQAIDWINAEIKNPTPHETYSPEEKIKALNESKEKLESSLALCQTQREQLKAKYDDLNLGIILETAKAMQGFNL